MIAFCCDSLRREAVRGGPLNGIDFVEVIDNSAVLPGDRQRFVHVHLLNDPGGVVYGPDHVVISGPAGELPLLDVQTGLGPQVNIVVVELLAAGGFGSHELRFRRGLLDDRVPVEFDPALARIGFNFKVECPSDFDCLTPCDCPAAPRPLPEFSYLARDIDSFRQTLLDRLAVLQPDSAPPHVVDQKMAMVDALAVLADRVAYAQDAAHSEAYLTRLQHRISARRLGLLVDYALDEGQNARCFVQVQVSADAVPIGPDFAPVVPVGTAFATRLPGRGVLLPPDPAVLAAAPLVFQAMTPLDSVFAAHERIGFHTWSDQRCCLPKGARAATLAGHFPDLAAGMFLGFEEVLGPRTGNPADADRTNRPVVRLTAVVAFAAPGVPLTDPVTGDPVTEIEWQAGDALARPLTLSAETAEEFGRVYLPQVSVARGNVLLADHGRSIMGEALGTVPGPVRGWAPGRGPLAIADARASGCHDAVCAPESPERITPRYAPILSVGPLTFAVPLAAGVGARALLAAEGVPQPALALVGTENGVAETYAAQRDLLGSAATARDVVAEIDNSGRANLRFGDDVNGLRPNAGTVFVADYRVGLGPSGNIGADRLVHVQSGLAVITGVRNLTPGTGGRRPESIKEMRRRAPFAFRRQDRAVTREDHDEMAARFRPPEGPLQGTVTDILHSGSWHTVLVTADRSGGLPVTAEFAADLTAHLDRYRMTGRDLAVDRPVPVPVEIDMAVCVCTDHLRARVKAGVLAVLSRGVLPDGTLGAFHPDRLAFGQPMYLSPLVALVQAVRGVLSVTVTRFQRFSDPATSGLAAGRLVFGRREIARLDNDPANPGNGVLRLTMQGGR